MAALMTSLPVAAQVALRPLKSYPPKLVKAGSLLFQQNCAFCHGRDAGGGETGPDLTRSKLVSEDVGGNKIGYVVKNGRPEKGMPRFDFSDPQMASLAAFIHTQEANSSRLGVDASDLKTGQAEAGKQYFNGAGTCASCHSPTGDLVGIASRYTGLQLEGQMLYPRNVKSTVTVTLSSGKMVQGTLAYQDEFTVALFDANGAYRSWRTRDVQYKVTTPVNVHVHLFSKYTDTDIHNLLAYLQTLR